jgi:hypothetical protein
MSTTVKTGWLKDENGDKFAPRTLTSQVQTNDGILLDDKIQKLDNLANVATSGSYNDLADKPTIPTLATETWTFTLEDGSTVTKAVYVG